MMDFDSKVRVFLTCKDLLADKVASLKEEITQTRQAASEETKSSMGDKYETGRAMLHLAREQLEAQLAEAKKSYNAVVSLKPTAVHDRVKVGSLVATDRGMFYISAGIGKISVDDQSIYCISASAPVGRLLLGLAKNDRVSFQGKPLVVKFVV